SGPQLAARYQNSPSASAGPARGWWQFEQFGGTQGVLTHPRSQKLALAVCGQCSVVAQSAAVWRSLEGHDVLSACFSRLLIWTDPHPLPTTATPGLDCYMRLWRPASRIRTGGKAIGTWRRAQSQRSHGTLPSLRSAAYAQRLAVALPHLR